MNNKQNILIFSFSLFSEKEKKGNNNYIDDNDIDNNDKSKKNKKQYKLNVIKK